MPPSGAIREAVELGAKALPALERGTNNLVDLLLPAARLETPAAPTAKALREAFLQPENLLPNGTHLKFSGPKGEISDAIATSKIVNLKLGPNAPQQSFWHTSLDTPTKQHIGEATFSLELAKAGRRTPYGPFGENQSSVNLDLVQISDAFTGKGARDALVGMVRDFSTNIGLDGRVKLLAVNDMGSVSAIPWYKSGFRVQPNTGLDQARLDAVSDILKQVVETRMQVPLQKGRIFDGLPMYLAERPAIAR